LQPPQGRVPPGPGGGGKTFLRINFFYHDRKFPGRLPTRAINGGTMGTGVDQGSQHPPKDSIVYLSSGIP
jgi:hypothetical protein